MKLSKKNIDFLKKNLPKEVINEAVALDLQVIHAAYLQILLFFLMKEP